MTILALVLVFSAVALAAQAVVPNISAVAPWSPSRVDVPKGLPGYLKTQSWFTNWFGAAIDTMTPLARRAPESLVAHLDVWLARAGWQNAVSVERLLATSAVLGGLIALPIWLIGVLTSPGPAIAGAFLGALAPIAVLFSVMRERSRLIVRALPMTLDTLSLLVAGGLDLQGALRHIIHASSPGPLRDELRLVVQGIDYLGVTPAKALTAMADRLRLPEVKTLVTTLVTTLDLGVPVAEALRTQAARVRLERLQHAEQEGTKAAQKLLIPLAFVMFPAVLVLILALALGPAIVMVSGFALW